MDQIKIDILREHLPFELDMLDEATAYLQSEEFVESSSARLQRSWFKRQAAIEAFWTHLRNLLEFLNRGPSKDLTVSSCSAKDFAKNFEPSKDIKRLWSRSDGNSVTDKIIAQVVHLGFGRKSLQSEKLGDEMAFVKPAIDKDIKRFEEQLDAECVEHWISRSPVRFILANAINSASTATMTTYTLGDFSRKTKSGDEEK